MNRDTVLAIAFLMLTVAASWVFRFQPSPTGAGTVLVNRVTGTHYFAGGEGN